MLRGRLSKAQDGRRKATLNCAQVCCENRARTLKIGLNVGIWPLYPRRIAHSHCLLSLSRAATFALKLIESLLTWDDVSWTAGGFFSPSDSARSSSTARS